METKMRMDAAAFESWMQKVLVQRGYDEAESSETASWAAQTASYEVETHGARKIFSLMDAEFARSGSCVPQAQHEVLLKTPSLEVWDGAKKLGPAISSIAQAHAVEMADATGMGAVMVRDCNHFGWGPAYALTHLEDNEDLVVGNITQGAIPIVTPIGGTEPTLGSNAIALALSTGADDCPFFLWDTGTAAMSWGEVEKLRAEQELGNKTSKGEDPGTLPVGGAVDDAGQPAVLASDASFLLPAGTIGNALAVIIELLSANLGAGDPRLRSEPPENVPDGEPTTCVFIFFALNLAMFDGLGFPAGRSRKENVKRMVDSIFKGNGSARIVGQRKWAAKKRSEAHGGDLLFAPESIVAFQEQSELYGVELPDYSEIEVAASGVAVAAKL